MKNACNQRCDDPFLLGYSYGFNPFQNPHKWMNHLLGQKASSPGKIALVETLERLYESDVEAFNRAYSTDFDAFADIQASTGISYDKSLNPGPGETSDRPHKRDYRSARLHRHRQDSRGRSPPPP